MENKKDLSILRERIKRIKILSDKKIDLAVLQERAKHIKLLVTDLDGTILDRNYNLSNENRRALVSLAEKGVVLAIATGRAHKDIPEAVNSISEIRYQITSNGAKIYSKELGKFLYERYLTPSSIEYIKPLLEDNNILCEVFWNGTPYIEEAHYNYNSTYNYVSHKGFGDCYANTIRSINGLVSVLLEHTHEIDSIRFVFADDVIKESTRPFLEARTDLYNLTSYRSAFFEIRGIGVDKASAVDFIARREGILQSETICLGDNENDVSMIEYAGIGIATTDAALQALYIADIIAVDDGQAGIAKTLKSLGLI